MCHKKLLICFALIAATQSYVLLADEEDFQQQLQIDENHYFDNIYQSQDVHREPRSVYIQDDEHEVLVSRPKRQDRGSVTATVDRNRQAGTNVNLDAQARLWQSQNRKSTLDGNANYQRNFGGQFGTGRPNYGVGLNFRHRF